MENLNPKDRMPKGVVLGGRRQVASLLESQAELLRSEGLDPSWPGFEREADQPSQATGKPHKREAQE